MTQSFPRVILVLVVLVVGAGLVFAAKPCPSCGSTDDGASWIRLGQATIPGQFVWEVPALATESARIRVKVYASTDTMTGTSGRSAIEYTLPLSGADVTSADSGSVSAFGSVHDVTFSGVTKGADSDNDGATSVLDFSSKGADSGLVVPGTGPNFTDSARIGQPVRVS